MPWEIRKSGSDYCVHKKDGGERVACHDSMEKAAAQMRALYASEADKEIEKSMYIDFPGVSSVLDQITNGIKNMFTSKQTEQSPIVVQKQLDGRTRVLMRVSNNFKDRHGEIITESAHKEYEAYVKESGKYPEFWLWHTKGSRWGQADLVSFDDGFLTVSGLVDTDKEYIAERLADMGAELGVSHGFRTISVQESGKGYINWYRMFEASPLPKKEAANLWTAMMLAKEWEMGLADKHRKFFTDIGVSATTIESWDKSSKDLGTLLREAGIEYKDIEPTPDPAPAPEPEPAPVPQSTITATGQATLDSVLEAVNGLGARIGGLEAKQKDLEDKVKDSVASTIEAAMASGKGYVASKANDNSPSADETATIKTSLEKDELIDLILGPVGSN